MVATKTKKAKTTFKSAGKVVKVPYENIVVDERDNVRTDYGDIDKLSFQIMESGLREPLKGVQEGEKVFLKHGFRRYRAITQLIKQGHPFDEIRVELEPKNYSEEAMLIDHVLLNEGKPLESLEEADLYKKLVHMGWERKRIALKVGKTEATVSNMLLLADAPASTRKMVENKIITATVAMNISRATKDRKEQEQILKEAQKYAKQDKKQKITAKHIKQTSAAKKGKIKNKSISSGIQAESVSESTKGTVEALYDLIQERSYKSSDMKVFISIMDQVTEGKTAEEILDTLKTTPKKKVKRGPYKKRKKQTA